MDVEFCQMLFLHPLRGIIVIFFGNVIVAADYYPVAGFICNDIVTITDVSF